MQPTHSAFHLHLPKHPHLAKRPPTGFSSRHLLPDFVPTPPQLREQLCELHHYYDMDLIPGTSRKRRNTDLCSPAPKRARHNDAQNRSLRETIDQIKHDPVGPDPKDAFSSKIWPSLRDEYDIMRGVLEEFCKNSLKSRAIKCQVESRTKAMDSVEASLERREKALWEDEKRRYENFSEIFSNIHDLVGIRIILEYPDDMHKAVQFIEESFREETKPTVFRSDRKVGRFWKPWFGAYQTRNYRLSLEDDKCETLSQFCGVMFEIQLTTVAEHLYNKFAHPLLYKEPLETLTRQDEMVIDMSHGVSLCYSLCLMYMKEKLGKDSDKIPNKDRLVAETITFQQTLKGTSFDTFSTLEGPATAVDIPPEAFKSTGDLKEWLDRRIRYATTDNLTQWALTISSDRLAEVRFTSQTIREAILSNLRVAEDAAFDSHAEEHNARCHPDTRADLLRQIRSWADDPQAESIFWLNGVAGTGKSTISRTVAKMFADESMLGASFFFKRGEGDRGKATLFFPTVASHLVCEIPALAPFLRDALNNNPGVATKGLRDQFEKLILQPLDRIRHATVVVIVIDALDECEGDNNVKAIISLLAQAKQFRSFSLRIFITSRPELPIRLGFKDVRGKYQDFALHQISEPIVKHDISTFLRHELARIRDDYNSQALDELLALPLDWPGENIIRTIAQMAVPLFIFAATICRFVEDPVWWDPANQLKKVLEYQIKGDDSELDKLDATYLPVLEQIIVRRTDPQRRRLLAEFRDVVGPIVLLAQPLSVSSLAKLLNLSPQAIYSRLNSVHSILDVPSQINIPVRLFHLSFRDFLVDSTKRAKEFWIDETQHHKTLADRCIRLLHQHLRRDICDLKAPGKLRSEVDRQTIDAALPPEAQYACQYWVHHLKESKSGVRDGGPIHSFLKNHLLHWLEALGLLGRISGCVGMVDDLLALSVCFALAHYPRNMLTPPCSLQMPSNYPVFSAI